MVLIVLKEWRLCHPERSEGYRGGVESAEPNPDILRFAQNDTSGDNGINLDIQGKFGAVN